MSDVWGPVFPCVKGPAPRGHVPPGAYLRWNKVESKFLISFITLADSTALQTPSAVAVGCELVLVSNLLTPFLY